MKGFTLIELLVVLGIMGIITIFTVPFLSTSIGQNELKNTTWELADGLRRARGQAMTGKKDDRWGMHLESKKFVIFKGTTYSAVGPENIVTDLPNILTITNISLNGGGSDILFNRTRGGTGQYGSITIQDDNSLNTSTVTISSAGRIGYN